MTICEDCAEYYGTPGCHKALNPEQCPEFRLFCQLKLGLGEAEAVRIQGGQDIVNTAQASLLVVDREWGKEVASQFPAYIGAQASMQIVRIFLNQAYPEAWAQFVHWAEKGLEQSTPYFETIPHADV